MNPYVLFKEQLHVIQLHVIHRQYQYFYIVR